MTDNHSGGQQVLGTVTVTVYGQNSNPIPGTDYYATNGLAYVLIVVAVYLKRLGRSITPVMVPMVFLLVMTTWAMLTSLGRWWFGAQPNYLMGIMGLIVLVAALWMALEAYMVLGRPGGPVAKPAEEAGNP